MTAVHRTLGQKCLAPQQLGLTAGGNYSKSTIGLLISSSVLDKESTRMHRKWRISALGAWRSGLALGWQSLTDRIPSLVRLS